MIILKHLTVERFRLLRELNMHFPQRGSILIQGPNEAGKSALLESIYFALYGESLAANRGKRSLDDLVLYGATNAIVTLTFSVGATELTVMRTIERGRGQKVVLHVQRLGMPAEEPITQLKPANERVVAELGRVNGETLRNSCLIEQKALERLESLSGIEREETIRKLLGLEKLTHLTEQFKVTPDDERLLQDAKDRLQLARIQARIPELSKQLEEIEVALDVVRASEYLDDIGQQEADIAEQEQVLEEIQSKRVELKSRQSRLKQLRNADATLAEIITAYDEIAEARRELPELEKQIAELERREREELPAMEKRVNELAELTRSFGTLQRMSNDLLTAVDTIKDLEKELKQHDEVRDDLKSLEEEVAHARQRLAQAQQALQDLEERRQAGKPQLEARLERMKNLSERLKVLRQVEDQYTQRLESKGRSEENSVLLSKVERDISETEQELELVEAEAKQTRQQADALEQRWRQLGVRRQMEEWLRLRGLAEGLSQAEQHVRMAHQHQEKLTQAAMDARASATKHMGIVAVCVVLFLLCLLAAFVEFQHIIWLAVAAGLAAIGLAAGAGVSFQNYSKVRKEEQAVDTQMREAINRVGMMVAAREAAVRMGGNQDALAHVEQEIRSLGGSVPRSIEEAQYFLRQTSEQSENLGDIQQRMKEKMDDANAARNQVNVTMEALATLRKERARLKDQHKKEDWGNLEENLREEQAAV
ncbi:MAG: AAA family ATPase, partial [Chloroflexi bacterium]|nr:AAA family ATPase [Chloroflexota bacterium]